MVYVGVLLWFRWFRWFRWYRGIPIGIGIARLGVAKIAGR